MAITTRGKLSKSAWVLIALLIVAIISLPLLHFTGFIDLTFIGDGFLAALMWASESVLNGILFVGGVFTGGALFYYAVKKYFLGTKVPMATPYMPRGNTIPQQEAKEEVTVT